MRIDTKVIHAGEAQEKIEGAVVLPIFQSSTFVHDGKSDYHDIKYIRLNNTPNHNVLHSKLAQLENAEDALVTASGMAAISTALFEVLGRGGHLLTQDTLYGGTHDLLNKDFADFGLSSTSVSLDEPDSWEQALRPETKAFYVETLSNPLIRVGNLAAVVDFAKEHGLVSLIDNTFAGPVLFRPAEWGFDLSLHSCTKYLNGHSDIVAGAVIGRSRWVERIRRRLNHLGGTLDPHACFLLHRGIKTLVVRMRHHCRAAQQIAEYLREHSGVRQVHYPGLPEHPDHARAARYLDGGFGGMLSFELAGGVEEADVLLTSLRLPSCAPSLGGVDSLVTRPAMTSHSGMTPEQRKQAGVSDSLVRFSTGLEDPGDIIEDLGQALAKAIPSEMVQA